MKDGSAPYYPIFLKISGRKCVVVGGGVVALRKVQALLEHGANVQVISPELGGGLRKLAEEGQIEVIRRHYVSGDLSGSFLAVAATDSSVTNSEVVAEAREKGILVNAVDDIQNSDFIVPSTTRRGHVTLAISTDGRSPALARKIRSRLEQEFGEEYSCLALLIDEVRAQARHEGIKVDGEGWQEALDLEALLSLVKSGRNEEARAILLNRLKAKQK